MPENLEFPPSGAEKQEAEKTMSESQKEASKFRQSAEEEKRRLGVEGHIETSYDFIKPDNPESIREFQRPGATFLTGNLDGHEVLLSAMGKYDEKGNFLYEGPGLFNVRYVGFIDGNPTPADRLPD